MQSHRFFKFIINSDQSLVKRYIYHLDNSNRDAVYSGRSTNNNETNLYLGIAQGEIVVQYHDHEFLVNYIIDDNVQALSYNTAKHEELSISIKCESRKAAAALLKEFILDATEFSKNKTSTTISTEIYKKGIGWMYLSKTFKRSMDTIYLDEKKKSAIIADIKDFYASKDEYRKFGTPYTRKYLFEGPPGVGKTSLISAIASMFDKSISMINFNNELDDASLMNAVKHLDKDSILVLEDIDNFFSNNDSHVSSVTFSGLLNTLDGFGRKDGMVVFMTTNNYKKLGDVLNRPGRIDYVLSFTEASEAQIKEMFLKFFPQQESSFKNLYQIISGKHVSMALMQKFFFDNRKCDNIIDKKGELRELITQYSAENLHMYI